MRANRPSLTARWVAARRATLAPTRSSTPTGDLEGERALYRDVSGNVTFNFARPSGVSHRTQFIDGEVADAVGRGVEQVVILGAGYDGRALRFGGGPTRWFEIDFPSTQADKRRRLAALGVSPVGVTYVPIDLMRSDLDATLENAGHDATAPTLFLAEGLVPYLTLEATATMFQALRARAAPGSVLVVTFFVSPEPSELLHALVPRPGRLLPGYRRTAPERIPPGRPREALRRHRVAGRSFQERARQPRRPAARMLVLAGEPV